MPNLRLLCRSHHIRRHNGNPGVVKRPAHALFGRR